MSEDRNAVFWTKLTPLAGSGYLKCSNPQIEVDRILLKSWVNDSMEHSITVSYTITSSCMRYAAYAAQRTFYCEYLLSDR